MQTAAESSTRSNASLHSLGTACGIAAGAWLGSAEAPTKLVSAGYSPVIISLCMVVGVFVARWTLPTIIKGTNSVARDMTSRSHLIVWAILAGALWAVANTLTVIAIRDVGLSIAFPIWNTNSLVGIFWGWLLFRELQGGGLKTALKVVGGTIAIILAAIMLAYASVHSVSSNSGLTSEGLVAALGASVMWGTMYVPYRKAYVSGMNPLSFVTIFTVGELGTMAVLALALGGGLRAVEQQVEALRPMMFWLFSGGFCWVIGDLFQQFATKYVGISRGIPISNTNQLWGMAWGALVFQELAGAGMQSQLAAILGSIVMVLGMLVVASAAVSTTEQVSWRAAVTRECTRYGLSFEEVLALQSGDAPNSTISAGRSWWDVLVVILAVSVFVWAAFGTTRPPIPVQVNWALLLAGTIVAVLAAVGWRLWRRTRFS